MVHITLNAMTETFRYLLVWHSSPDIDRLHNYMNYDGHPVGYKGVFIIYARGGKNEGEGASNI